jgi:hypothetical protein
LFLIDGALLKAFTFILIMMTGFLLKKRGYYQERDFYTVTKLIVHITLPAVIIHGFSRFERDDSLILIVVLSLAFNFVQSFIGYLMAPKSDKPRQAFNFLNYSGYNIGNFSLPFFKACWIPLGSSLFVSLMRAMPWSPAAAVTRQRPISWEKRPRALDGG